MADNEVRDFKDLIVWKRGMELAKAVHWLARMLPRQEERVLADQMRRSSVSIPSNIAEGYGRSSRKDYARFLAIARGSSYELETQILLCVDLGYLREADATAALGLCKEVERMTTRILKKLESE